MKKIYDKILFLLAFLVVLAGAGMYVVISGSSPEDGVAGNVQGPENPYQSVPVPQSESEDASWPKPDHQPAGEDWRYQVFTPPKIYINEKGEFVAEEPVPPPPLPKAPPFGLYLAEMERELYRIQLEGYIEHKADPSKSIIFLFDEERDVQLRLRAGAKESTSEIQVISFKVTRSFDPSTSMVEKKALAILKDLRSGKEVQLIDGEPYYEPGLTVRFLSREDPTIDLFYKNLPLETSNLSFETSLGKYIAKKINLEEKSVTVEKQAFDVFDAETEILPLIQSQVIPPPENRKQETPAVVESNDALDGIFAP